RGDAVSSLILTPISLWITSRSSTRNSESISRSSKVTFGLISALSTWKRLTSRSTSVSYMVAMTAPSRYPWPGAQVVVPRSGQPHVRPCQQCRTPGDPASACGEQDAVTGLQRARGLSVGKCQRDGGGSGVPDLGDVTDTALGRNAEFTGEPVQDPGVRLMANQPVDVVEAKPSELEHRPCRLSHVLHRLPEDLLAGHREVVIARRGVHPGEPLFRAAGPHCDQVPAVPVTAEIE